MRADVRSHQEVFAEPAQILLRLKGDERGYEKMKAAVERGEFTSAALPVKNGYVGLATELALGCKKEALALLRPTTRRPS